MWLCSRDVGRHACAVLERYETRRSKFCVCSTQRQAETRCNRFCRCEGKTRRYEVTFLALGSENLIAQISGLRIETKSNVAKLGCSVWPKHNKQINPKGRRDLLAEDYVDPNVTK